MTTELNKASILDSDKPNLCSIMPESSSPSNKNNDKNMNPSEHLNDDENIDKMERDVTCELMNDNTDGNKPDCDSISKSSDEGSINMALVLEDSFSDNDDKSEISDTVADEKQGEADRENCSSEVNKTPENPTIHDKCDSIARQIDNMRFRDNLFEIIEELRIRRSMDAESEDKIKQLVTEKHELERKLESENLRNKNIIDNHDQEISDVKKQYQDKIHQLEEKTTKHTLTVERSNKQMTALKNDIRTLEGRDKPVI
ncbi:uncharacterized protein LOC102803625 [Saccoglossus kowalevskii]